MTVLNYKYMAWASPKVWFPGTLSRCIKKCSGIKKITVRGGLPFSRRQSWDWWNSCPRFWPCKGISWNNSRMFQKLNTDPFKVSLAVTIQVRLCSHRASGLPVLWYKELVQLGGSRSGQMCVLFPKFVAWSSGCCECLGHIRGFAVAVQNLSLSGSSNSALV